MARRAVSIVLGSRWVPLTVLAVGLTATFVVAAQLRRVANDREKQRFQNAVQRLEEAVNQRIIGYVALLRATAGMVGSHEGNTSVAEFHAFVERMNLAMFYPGARGIGITRRVLQADLPKFVENVRSTMHDPFSVQPETPRPEYYVVTLMEPMDERNTMALGYDMFTDPGRRAAMERARDEGTAIITKRISLLQDAATGGVPAFIMYVPIYKGSDVPPTVALRRTDLAGFAYVPFRGPDFFDSIYGAATEETAFAIYAGAQGDDPVPLYDYRPDGVDNHVSRFRTNEAINIAGERWTLTACSTPAFERDTGIDLARAAEVVGVALTLLMTATMALQTRARVTAERERSATAAAEASARTFAERLELVLKGARVGLWYSNLPFERLAWDERVKAHFFMPPDEQDITVEKAFSRVYPDDRERIRAAMGWSIREHAPFDVEYRTVSPDGTRMNWIRSIGQTFVDERGKPTRFDVLTVDVTALKEAQETLAASETRFRQLANSMSQQAWIARPDGWIIWYNARWHDYTDIPADAAPGWAWERIGGTAGDSELIAQIKLQIASGEPLEVQHTLVSAAGQQGWFLTRAVPLRDAGGNLVFWFGTSTDLTHQRQLAEEREQLLKSERSARSAAERAGRLKDEFLATLSHELRTPLNAILGWAQILQRQYPDDAELQDGLAVIERNARVQTQLVSDLLDMSRIISGKLRVEASVVDPSTIIMAAVDSVRFAADAKEIRLVTSLDAQAVPVHGDPSRLQQVIWNLLTNAIKFTRHGGFVSINVRRHAKSVLIEVTDDGEGIDPQFLPYLFERFSQADASTTRRHGGLGLGLAIVKNLVELHGGKVWAQSAGRGNGSSFVVELPTFAALDGSGRGGALLPPTAARAATRPARVSRDMLAGVRVLVVDDEADAREMIRRILVEAGAHVVTAEGGRAALALAQRNCPDVIISDIGMPEQDGYQFLRAARAIAHLAEVPAAAVTAFARHEDRSAVLRAGYQAHVAKPVESGELLSVVARLAGRGEGQTAPAAMVQRERDDDTSRG